MFHVCWEHHFLVPNRNCVCKAWDLIEDYWVFLFVTYIEFVTRFELKVVVLWSQCNFLSQYRILSYFTYRYTLGLKEMYFNFRRYWVLYLRHLQGIFSTSLSNVSGLFFIPALTFVLAINVLPCYVLKPFIHCVI